MPRLTKPIFVCFVLVLAVSASEGSKSGEKWSVIDVHEFFIYNGSATETYDGARRKCIEMKSHLVIVDTDEMHFLLVDLIKRILPEEVGPPFTSFYIGLRDYTGRNTNYIWDNGDILHFIVGTPMQWADGEPNDFNGIPENCVTMGSIARTEHYKWFDVPCSSQRSYICQRFTKAAVPIVSVQSYIVSSCAIVFIVCLIASTAIYHRRRILHVHLVAEPPLSPYNNYTVEKERKSRQDDEVIKTRQNWISKHMLHKKNSISST